MTRFVTLLSLLSLFTLTAAAQHPPEFKEAYKAYTELVKQEKYGEAIPYAQKALDIALESDAFDDGARGLLAFNLGHANFRNGRLSDAAAAFTVAIQRLEKAQKPDRYLIAEALLYRGTCYRRLYKDKEAEDDLTKVIGMLTETTPTIQMIRAETLHNLAWVMVRLRRQDDGRKYAAEALGIYSRHLSGRHPRTLRSRVLVAAIEFADGNSNKARTMLADAVADAEMAGIVPEGATEKTSPDQFTLEELAVFHDEVSQMYAIMRRDKDAEYHRELAADLYGGGRPAVLSVKPVDRKPPTYPTAAAREGIMGWVLVEYTVRKDGSTADIEIVDAAPEGYFEHAALAAVRQWKYEPPLEDGKPSDVTRVRTMIQFKFELGSKPSRSRGPRARR